MNDDKLINIGLHPSVKIIKAFLAMALMVVLSTACIQSTGTPVRGIIIPSTPPIDSDAAVKEAKNTLANQLGTSVDSVQLLFAQSIQWSDSCLGVTQTGVMCAMHMVDGYKIQLSSNNHTYEMHTNLDGSQIVRVPGLVPIPAGISYTIGTGEQCKTFLIKENQNVLHGSCDKPMEAIPFIETYRASELAHFIANYHSFMMNTHNGFVNFIGKGDTEASSNQQRSMAAWADLVANEITAGRSSAGNGVVIGWHREGGLAGFCDDVTIYVSGAAAATTCKSGNAEEVGKIWLNGEQLDQLYQWIDNFARFEYNPATNATADAMTIYLIVEGQGKNPASEDDQEVIASFAQEIYSLAK
jgi:hypothetical protein